MQAYTRVHYVGVDLRSQINGVGGGEGNDLFQRTCRKIFRPKYLCVYMYIDHNHFDLSKLFTEA